jgi:hypothetical protein
MTPEKFFDYLEGKLPDWERQALERALITDPELQKEFVAARQIHRSLDRSPEETAAIARAGARGRMIAAAFAVLVALNVAIGLYFIFRSAKPAPEVQQAQVQAIRQQIEKSLAKAASATFTPPTIAAEPVLITIPAAQQDDVARTIIAAAEKAGGSATKGLVEDNTTRVFVLVPASAEAEFRKTLSALGAAAPSATSPSPASPNEPVHLEIVLSPAVEPH